ncbi:ROK family transcriptional regulator [Planotetraspora kaengkrachanensis]|uniref:Sugar kinase n=1 Tax=Planotetraspora kaengkrachanensis TaxID=575193 RepID=A0A8J3PXG3_9ACTN|nr:sugar kinase [Planotetraspora kaengkrachanensis]
MRRTVRDLRRGNRAVLLRSLYFGGPASRNELSATTGLSAATVSNMTGDLLGENVIVEAGQVDSDGGRPRMLLRVNPEYGFAVGVDVGETHVRVELFDLDMKERAKVEYALRTARHEVELVVRHIIAGIDVVLAEGGVSARQVLGVGVGVPGIVESGPEGLVQAKTFGWEGVPLKALLREGTSLPLFVDNGAKTMGQAELWFGSGRGAGNAVIVFLGSGIGATLVTDGTTYRGAASAAGELGHVKVTIGGRACRCGGRGCLEAYAGAEGILDRAGIHVDAADEERALAALVKQGSPVVDETIAYLGIGLANMIHLFDPERVVIGGWAGLILGRERLDDIRAVVADNCHVHPLPPGAIVLGSLGPDAVALGAAALVVEDFLSDSGAARTPAAV